VYSAGWRGWRTLIQPHLARHVIPQHYNKAFLQYKAPILIGLRAFLYQLLEGSHEFGAGVSHSTQCLTQHIQHPQQHTASHSLIKLEFVVCCLSSILIAQMWSWATQPSSHAQRKFIELIYDRTGKYANWDPPSEMRVRVISCSYLRPFMLSLIRLGISEESKEPQAT